MLVRRRRYLRAMQSRRKDGSNSFIFGDAMAEVDRQILNVRKHARSFWSSSRSETTITPMNTYSRTQSKQEDPLDLKKNIKETISLDGVDSEIQYYLPDWVIEYLKKPAGWFNQTSVSKQQEEDEVVVVQEEVFEDIWGDENPVSLITQDMIRIVVDTSHGLGLSLARTFDGTILVDRFNYLKNKQRGPVETSGVVWVGDQLIKIDELLVKGWSLSQCAKTIRNVVKSRRKLSLVFKSSATSTFLSYGVFQVNVPRNFYDLGLSFESDQNLFVISKNAFGPLRNIVPTGSRLTAVDGHPISTLNEFKVRLKVHASPSTSNFARLRFEAPVSSRGSPVKFKHDNATPSSNEKTVNFRTPTLAGRLDSSPRSPIERINRRMENPGSPSRALFYRQEET